MHIIAKCLCALALATLPLAAHADTIDDFVFTSASHTIAYSLPATSISALYPTFVFFGETSTATIDGVSGYSVGGQYRVEPFVQPFTVILSVPASIFGNMTLYLDGPQFYSYLDVPGGIYGSIQTTFIPGTYTFQSISQSGQPFSPPVSYTLTVTPELTPSSVPEPSPLFLLATAILAIILHKAISSRRMSTIAIRI